jgi:hypothetical protein
MKNHTWNNQAGFTVPSFLGVIGVGSLLSLLIPSPWNVLAMVGMAAIIVVDVANNDDVG